VTIQQTPAHTPAMRDIENQVRSAVQHGETMEYSVTPIYEGDNPVAVAITIQAKGSNGFNIAISVLNRAGV
jgi:DNA/RNA non-specific endonuclease